MTTATTDAYKGVSEKEYNRRIRAWTMYDWANSAFATTILAAVLPVYYSQVAGATLPSAATATAYWSTGLSVSLFITAIFSPILGTISDVMRGKKRFLSFFVTIAVIATGLLIVVQRGDWMLASILFILGRIGFTSANVFYDALLPHVARDEDQDRVSTRGYAMGYLGGGILLAINVAMIQFLPGTWGPRLSFLSVAIWWAVFSIPVLTRVPEPPAAPSTLDRAKGMFSQITDVVSISFDRLKETFKDIQQYRELFKYLLAFLIYNDGIGTIIGVAVIYGAELGFGSVELILALLMVQFAGIPFSLVFGRLPSSKEKRRPFFLAFVLFNLIALPLVGVMGNSLLPADVSGVPPAPYADMGGHYGEGSYLVSEPELTTTGDWMISSISAQDLGTDDGAPYAHSADTGAMLSLAFNGQEVELTYSSGPEGGIWAVEMDGKPLIDEDSGEPVEVDSYQDTVRYGETVVYEADSPGEHTLSLVNTGRANSASKGTEISVSQATVLQPKRVSNLMTVIGMILAVEVVGLIVAALLAKPVFGRLAESMDTKRSIILALSVYAVIAIWGYFLDSVIEFWFLAWMVAVVQGGSQALSRSLYASMSPAAKSGEFFGLFGIMEKFSSIVGPLIFAAAVATFGSSRPAILSIIVFFFLGGYLLTRVNVEEGRRRANEEDARLLGTTAV
jgi:UMF1 family MFS transporter